jgi:hypothetical protein
MSMLLFAAAALIAAPAADAPKSPDKCPRATAPYYAYRDGKPLKPHKLTELPSATTYMAVFRHVGTCAVPLTMSDYRNRRGR